MASVPSMAPCADCRNLPDVSQALVRDGSMPICSSPPAFAAWSRSEIDKWAKVVKASGGRAD